MYLILITTIKIKTQDDSKTVGYTAEQLVVGVYTYTIVDDTQEQFHGWFLIK